MVLSARDGGDDADFIPILQFGLLVFEETDVLLVDINVDEAADCAAVVEQTLLETGEASLKFSDCLIDGRSVDLNDFFVVGELAKWGGDSDFFCHRFQLDETLP